MFEQSLVNISQETSGRKRWTALLSFSIQALAVIATLLFPLLHTEALPLDDAPRFHPPTRFVPSHVDLVPAPPHMAIDKPRPINVFQQPASIPRNIDRTPEPSQPYFRNMSDGIPDGSIPVTDPGEQNSILASMLHSATASPVHHATLVPRSSKAQESLLVRQIKPSYPSIAIQARIQGSVVLQAVIARDGTIQHLEVLSGHPMLVKAAVDAVHQWRYRPFLLDDQPVEVETQITVNFNLNGR